MAKKALVSTIELRGKNNSGYRVIEVVEVGNEFEVNSNLQWKDCDDSVIADCNWFDPTTNTFKKLSEHPTNIMPETAQDEEGNDLESLEWDWDNEIWKKVQIINN